MIDGLQSLEERTNRSRKNSRGSSEPERRNSGGVELAPGILAKTSRSRFGTIGNPSPRSSLDSDDMKPSSSASSGDEKIRSWKRASTAATQDIIRELEEEQQKRVALEEYKREHEKEIESLKRQVDLVTRNAELDKRANLHLKNQLADMKEKLVNSTMQLMNCKSGDSDVTTKESGQPQNRSWNKKMIVDTQEVGKQYNTEKKMRRDLEQWKVENESKMEEMKKKVRAEMEIRMRLEEEYKKLEQELTSVKASNS